ncbi:hypothetical protein HK100_005951, partial [Physocladia obscura]
MPSVKPLEFSGNFKGKPAHELQNFLDDYLDGSLELCQLYNFARTIGTATYAGQPTYVQFVSSGLTEHTHIAWRQLTEQRTEGTWNFYKEWIQQTFGSTLTLSQAVEAMEDLHQTGAATQYSAAFNELVSAISAAGVTYPEQHLCAKYFNGLKSHLQIMPDLYWIHNNLRKLHQEAEKIDDLYFHCNCKPRAKFSPPNIRTPVPLTNFKHSAFPAHFHDSVIQWKLTQSNNNNSPFDALHLNRNNFFVPKD